MPLNSDQKARFADVNARLGLGPDEFTAALSPGELAALPPVRIMSSTGDSHFPCQAIAIGSVEEMRKIVGRGDFVPPAEGSEPDYPVAPSQEEIDQILNAIKHNAKPQISQELWKQIKQATMAYVLGNPKKVAAFVPLINATQFPGRAAVFTGDTLHVPSGASHIITGDDPVVLNYGQITVAHGATIKVKAGAFINSQVFTQELGSVGSAGSVTLATTAPAYTIENIGEPWATPATQGGAGPTGAVQTNKGVAAASSYNSSTCQYNCTTQQGTGPAGNTGLVGLIGAPGAQGHPSAGGPYNLGMITNPVTMLLGGGDGQQGGKGGTGGAGGPGGAPGAPATGCVNNAGNGPQGAGGQGGNGGPGGPGGDSGYVTVYYSYTGAGPGITVTVRTVAGGGGGLPGDPGAGPTNNGSGNTGTPPGAQGPIPKYALNKS